MCGTATEAHGQELLTTEMRGEVLRLEVDRGLENVRHFVLKDPPRLVLDLHGIREASAVPPAAVPLDSIAGLRVGRHPDKVRVVVDFKRSLRPYRLRSSQRVVEVDLASLPLSETPIPVPSLRQVDSEVPGLRLEGEGSLERVKDFVMAKPPRLVLDLYGLQDVSALLKGAHAPLSITSLRKSRYPEKIRLVVDFERPLEAYRVRYSGSVVEVDMRAEKSGPSPVAVQPDASRADPAEGARPTRAVSPGGSEASAPPPAPAASEFGWDDDPIGAAIRGMLTQRVGYSMHDSGAFPPPVVQDDETDAANVVSVRN